MWCTVTDVLQQQLDAKEIVAPGLEEAEDYGPLPLQNLIVGREIPFDVYLKIQKKGQMLPQFVKGVARGEIFQEAWHQKLLLLKIPCVYLSVREMEQVLQYLHQNLEIVLADNTKSELEKGARVCDATHLWALNFFSAEEARTRDQVKLGQQFLDSLFNLIQSDHHNILHLMEIRRQKSLRLFTHSLNVCLLGLAFTSYLGWSPEKAQAFGLGALVHDIGLSRTPREILEKKGKLTAEEMWEIKRHPIDGFRKVQVFVHLRWDALQMVLQHHENGDGSGYPAGLKLGAIHSWARILRILDSYEAMTAKRPWRPAMESKEALWTMQSDWKKSNLFDQNYLKAFIKFLKSK